MKTLRRTLILTFTFLLAGVLMSAGYAPISFWLALPLGIALWVRAIETSANTRTVIFGSIATSLCFFLIVLHWSSAYVGWFPWVLLSFFESLILAPVGLAIRAFSGSRWFPWALGGFFVLDESIRSRFPWGGFGWARLAFEQPSYFTKLASIGGAPLLTFSLGALAGFFALMTTERRSISLALATVFILGAPMMIPANRASKSVNVAAVQGNVPRLGLDFNAQREAVLRFHVKATRDFAAKIRGGAAAKPALIVWPENASDVDPLHDPLAAQLISQTTDEIATPILVGGVSESPHIQNISVLWVPRAGPTSIYTKQHLAPFAEYLPLRSIAEYLVPAAKRIADMKPGHRTVTHRIGKIRLGDVICFEIIEDDLVRRAVVGGRANLMAVQTNSATFGRSPESEQQLAVSRERAIEHGRSIISASTSGRSALLTPDGSIVQVSNFFESAVLQADMPVTNHLTIADHLGNWPEAFLIAVPIFTILRRAKAGHR